MAISITLNTPHGGKIPRESLRRGIRLAFQAEKHTEGEISITFLEDAPIRDLNLTWLNHDWVPDVLSFPLTPTGIVGEEAPPIGDIYIGVGQAARQAEEHGIPYEEELLRLAIHGTLHILGYDHTEFEAERGEGAHFLQQEALVQEVMRDKAGGSGMAIGESVPEQRGGRKRRPGKEER